MLYLTRVVSAVLIIVTTALSFQGQSTQSAVEKPTGKLAGVVLDPDGAAVSNAQVVMEGVGFRLVIAATPDGTFESEIPVGIYRVMAIREFTQLSPDTYALITASATTRIKLILKKVTLAETIRESHIKSNVPDEKDFDAFLKRDLKEHFNDAGPSIQIEYELLRNGPTQSGVAFPKFYLWVVVKSEGKTLEEGAVRVAAIEKREFEVVTYMTRPEIKQNSERLNQIFPAEVVERIREKLKQ